MPRLGEAPRRLVRRLRRELDALEVHRALAGASWRTDRAGVALTFDDGPVPGGTDRVLDVLSACGVQATFFCVGRNAVAHPRLLERIAAEGHAVGSHSMTHPHPAAVPLRRLRQDYRDGRRAVEDVLGRSVPMFRPPHGHLDLGSALLLRARHGPVWLWSVDPEDWRPGARAPRIVDVAAAAGRGDVVLMHDWVEQPWEPSALDRSATVGALPDIIGTLRARGLTLEVVEP